jgi:citrate synthase
MAVRSTDHVTHHRRRRPTPLRHDGRDYLTTAQVARVLGVKTQTVYAYVSRGLLTSAAVDGVRGSVFAVDEVDALTRRSAGRPPAGVVERIRTQITLLDDDHLYYRGQDAAALSTIADYEAVGALLWQGDPEWGRNMLSRRVVKQLRALSNPAGRRVDLIRMAIDVLGSRDTLRHQLTHDVVTQKAAGILDTVVDCLPVVSGQEAVVSSLAARLWPRLTSIPANRSRIRLLNAALVLLADHDLTASTVAARVAASARGSIYSVVTAGLGALDGPLHGGASTRASRFLTDALDDPAGALAVWSGPDQATPGFGHVVYRDLDPRAEALFELMATTTGGNRTVIRTIEELRGLARRTDAGFLNSDMALAAIAVRFDMSPDAAETIFAIARIAGWVAHAIEEYDEPRLRFRPQGVYVGVRPPAT